MTNEPPKNINNENLKTYSQEEFDEIYRLHRLYIRQDVRGVKADLSNANLTNLKLSGLTLSNMVLKNSDLSHMNLIETNFSYSDLSSAKLDHAFLHYSNFQFSNLQKTTLSYAGGLNSAMLDNSKSLLVVWFDVYKIVLVSPNHVNIEGYTRTFENALKMIEDLNIHYKHNKNDIERYKSIIKFMEEQVPLYFLN